MNEERLSGANGVPQTSSGSADVNLLYDCLVNRNGLIATLIILYSLPLIAMRSGDNDSRSEFLKIH